MRKTFQRFLGCASRVYLLFVFVLLAGLVWIARANTGNVFTAPTRTPVPDEIWLSICPTHPHLHCILGIESGMPAARADALVRQKAGVAGSFLGPDEATYTLFGGQAQLHLGISQGAVHEVDLSLVTIQAGVAELDALAASAPLPSDQTLTVSYQP
jgi:hypothetical protein